MSSDPPHLSSLANDKAMALYTNQAKSQQELFAMPVGEDDYVFKPYLEQLNKIMLTDVNGHRFMNEVQVLYSFHDPSGGGASNASVFTWAPDAEGLCVVTGMDIREKHETAEGWDDSDRMLYRHYDAHRIHPRYANAHIEIAIEVGSNPDLANRMGLLLEKRYGSAVTVTRSQKSHPEWIGVVTRNEEKRGWVRNMVDLFKREKIRFSRDLIGANLDTLKQMLLEESGRYCKKTLRSGKVGENDSFFSLKETFSGKEGGFNDDMITAAIASLYQQLVLKADLNSVFMQRMRAERRLLL
jgi:hypothetical protein